MSATAVRSDIEPRLRLSGYTALKFQYSNLSALEPWPYGYGSNVLTIAPVISAVSKRQVDDVPRQR